MPKQKSEKLLLCHWCKKRKPESAFNGEDGEHLYRAFEGKKIMPLCVECGKNAAEPDWALDCENCGERPIVPCTGLCGPCTFGEAETAGGNW